MPRLRADGLFGVLLAGLLSITAAACDSPFGLGDGDGERLEDNRARWAARGFESYDLTVQRLCFCGSVEPVRVEVRNGQPVSVVVAGTGEPVLMPASFPTVPGLFDIVEDAIERDAHELHVEYDPDRGVPVRIEIDYNENTVDEEVTWVVISLVRR